MAATLHAITVALENEARERDFYLAQSAKTSNPIGRKMFQQIAADEDGHYQRLLSIHEELFREGVWPESVATAIGSSDIGKTFRRLADQADTTSVASRDDIAALNIAIEFETKGHGFYIKLSLEAATAPEKMFFKILANLEWEHLLTLKDAVLFYENPSDWLARTEKPQLEG